MKGWRKQSEKAIEIYSHAIFRQTDRTTDFFCQTIPPYSIAYLSDLCLNDNVEIGKLTFSMDFLKYHVSYHILLVEVISSLFWLLVPWKAAGRFGFTKVGNIYIYIGIMVVLKLKKINLMLLFPEQLTMKDKKGRRYNNLIEMIRFQWFDFIIF